MRKNADSIAQEIVRLRRDIHQNPELGFEETRTAALVADTLQEIGGISVKTGVGITGVIGEIGTGDGPTIAIRADMDALPIQEANDVAYASQTEGVMHACGHDAHTAMLLGAAHLLKQSFATEKWKGNVKFIFQPSEEKFDDKGISGAPMMLREDILDDVDSVIALHVASTAPAGVCLFQDGYSMAAVDSWNAKIFGTGAHGAYPHTGTDPIFMLNQTLSYLYSIPSRIIDPLKPCVVSVGHIDSGATTNVIPAEAFVQGTMRSYDPEVRLQLQAEVEKAFRLAEQFGGSYEFNLLAGYPSLFNDAKTNGWMRSVAKEVAGEDMVQEYAFGMGAEDFAYMTQKTPGAMFMLGAAIDDGIERNHHTPIFDIDESVLPIGSAILAETARKFVLGQLS